jgi:hypothetical protein
MIHFLLTRVEVTYRPGYTLLCQRDACELQPCLVRAHDPVNWVARFDNA